MTFLLLTVVQQRSERMRTPLSSILLVAVILVSTTLASSSLSVNNSGAVSNSYGGFGKWFDYVVVIMMENHSLNFTYGVSNSSWNSTSRSCLGNCTYYTSLADANGLAKDYTNFPVQGGSAGNYVAITSGDGSLGSTCNNGPTGACKLNESNIVDSLENKHLTWKGYVEGCPTGCGGISTGCANIIGGTGGPNWYSPNHNPFIYYSNIQNNVTRCSHIVSANSLNLQPTDPTTTTNHCWPITIDKDDLFINDLNSANSATASNYMFLTPNAIDDNHDCNDVSVGNAWLQQLVPQILNSTLFKTRRAALFITFDEPYCTYSGCPNAIQQMYSIWASNPTNPTTIAQHKSNVPYTHFSQLKTVEDNWSLPPLRQGDGNSNNMAEFLK